MLKMVYYEVRKEPRCYTNVTRKRKKPRKYGASEELMTGIELMRWQKPKTHVK